MTKEMLILPQRCQRCSRVFDLWNDLMKGDSRAHGRNEFLCAECREIELEERELEVELTVSFDEESSHSSELANKMIEDELN